MKISELIAKLEKLKAEHGDVIVALLDTEWGEYFEVVKCGFDEGRKPTEWDRDIEAATSRKVTLQ